MGTQHAGVFLWEFYFWGYFHKLTWHTPCILRPDSGPYAMPACLVSNAAYSTVICTVLAQGSQVVTPIQCTPQVLVLKWFSSPSLSTGGIIDSRNNNVWNLVEQKNKSSISYIWTRAPRYIKLIQAHMKLQIQCNINKHCTHGYTHTLPVYTDMWTLILNCLVRLWN